MSRFPQTSFFPCVIPAHVCQQTTAMTISRRQVEPPAPFPSQSLVPHAKYHTGMMQAVKTSTYERRFWRLKKNKTMSVFVWRRREGCDPCKHGDAARQHHSRYALIWQWLHSVFSSAKSQTTCLYNQCQHRACCAFAIYLNSPFSRFSNVYISRQQTHQDLQKGTRCLDKAVTQRQLHAGCQSLQQGKICANFARYFTNT